MEKKPDPGWDDSTREILRKGWARGDSRKVISSTIGRAHSPSAIGAEARRLKLGIHPNIIINPETKSRVGHVLRDAANTSDLKEPKITGVPSMPPLPVSRFTNSK